MIKIDNEHNNNVLKYKVYKTISVCREAFM